MRNKKNCLKVKLLHNLRKLSESRIGVFFLFGQYCVILNIDRYFGDTTYHGLSHDCDDECKSLKEAKERCDYYRRNFILKKVSEMKEDRRYY